MTKEAKELQEKSNLRLVPFTQSAVSDAEQIEIFLEKIIHDLKQQRFSLTAHLVEVALLSLKEEASALSLDCKKR